MNILVMPHFVVIKWVFLVQVLTILMLMTLITMKMILELLFISLLSWHIIFGKRKALKKDINEELMLAVWHPKRWWNFCMSEDKKKEIEPIFTE